jgi:hypothetical protein
VLNYQIIASEGATVASTVTYLLPVVAIVLGVLVLGESVTVTVLAGIGLVLAGVAMTRYRAKKSTGDSKSERSIRMSSDPFESCDNFLCSFKGAPSARRA